MHNFTIQVEPGLIAPDDSSWTSLFPRHPDSGDMVALMSESGLAGFQFYTLVVRNNEEVVLLMPLFFTRYSLASTLDGKTKTALLKLEKFLPDLLNPKVLGLGFVEGEWGQVGINTRVDRETIDEAFAAAMRYLNSFATSLGASIIAFKDFTERTLQQVPAATLAQFAQAVSLPFCQLAVPFKSLEDYLESLPRKVRQDLRRKIRQSADVEVRYTSDPMPWIDQIFSLYKQQMERTDLSFGEHNIAYFRDVCKKVSGAQYMLFFHNNELFGFNLIVDRGFILVDKYIGMVSEQGRLHNIYFIAWLEKVKYCIEHKIELIHLGASAEGVKVRLGAGMLRSYVLFKHRNALVNLLLRRFIDNLSYQAAAEGPYFAGTANPLVRPVVLVP